MDASYWHQRWARNDIAFHEGAANPLLVSHFDALSLAGGDRVFVPLCGKTHDIAWLLDQGCRVVGAELSKVAIEQLFAELGTEPEISEVGGIERYSANDIDIFVGDLFELTNRALGPVDAIYDRAALVALPQDMRQRYTAHLMAITAAAPQLLICYEYDQGALAGPPFAVSQEEVRQHYGDRYDVNLRATLDIPGGLKGKCAAKEHVWLLNRR
jgi:thiopurine S-methyltransferase